MADYMLQISYSAAAYAALIKHPENRVEAVGKVIEKLGGKVGGYWFSFGDHDLVGIIEMPDNVSAAAFSMAISAGGACKHVKTTPLLQVEDALHAMKKAGKCGYKPVGGKK
jgi:uncharacterized protein with GYD domain